MKKVFLIDGCRSPIGRAGEKGLFHDLRADDLALQVFKLLIKRTGLDIKSINDLFLGCVGQHLEQGKNLARLIAVLADLPDLPGVTINRLCASSLSALQMAADSIRAGNNNQLIVGGVEHLGHVPMASALNYHNELFKNYDFPWTNMGLTAEKLALDFGITRQNQDEYTQKTNLNYFEAKEAGFFKREIVPVELENGETVADDQGPRMSTLENLGVLKPVFKEGGSITAANSSGLSDGACMAWVGDSSAATSSGKPPLAEIGPGAVSALNPENMGLGPVSAIQKLLKNSGLSLSEIDLFEINEAFAVQVLACKEKLGINPNRLNIHGGAVALGHPLGMTGLRIAVTLAHSMVEKNAQYGIAALCVGHGQGQALLLKKAS